MKRNKLKLHSIYFILYIKQLINMQYKSYNDIRKLYTYSYCLYILQNNSKLTYLEYIKKYL